MEKHGSNRDRQPKFTNEELAIILGEVSRHKDVMLSRSLDQETSKFKRQFWQDVAAKLNAVNGHSLRTANEMHFKWRDWKSRTMRKVAHYQRVASEGKAVDDKSALSDIEQRLVILLAGTSEDDDSDGNSEDGSKLGSRDDDGIEGMDGEAELETSAASVRAARAFVAAFDSFRASGALPTQVNSRVSQTRTDVDEHDRESSSVSLHSPGAPKRQRLAPAEPTLRNGEAKQASAVNGAAASSSDHVADAILRHAGDQSVLLFTLLSTQLKQVQDLAESQREQLRLFQEFVRKHDQADANATENGGSACAKCVQCRRRGNADSAADADRPRQLLDHTAPELAGLSVSEEVIQPFQLSELRGNYVLLLFYPHDFTTESRQFILSFSARAQQFQSAGCRLVACSTDSQHSHLAWIRMRKEQGGLGRTDLTLLADCTGDLARRYNVYNYHDGTAHFSVIVIDDKGLVKHMVVTQSANADVDGVFKLVRSFQQAV